MVSVTLAVAVGVLSFYIVRFAKMIFSVEDQLSNVIKVLIDLEKSQKDLLDTEFYFESPELKHHLDEILTNIQFSRQAVILLINDFTKLSKEKYITTTAKNEKNEEEDEEDLEEDS